MCYTSDREGEYMYRKMEEQLLLWKQQEDRKPLIIKGARQVGKTYTIREFANHNYDHIIEVNFELDTEYVSLFEQTIKPEEIMAYIEIKNFDVDLESGEVLLFLDEIQACPQAITALKFFKERCPYDVIASGSMLGVAIASTSSFSVGYVEMWDMLPMDFEEFMLAIHAKTEHIQILKDAFQTKKAIAEPLHELFLDYFKQYLICGGMPEVVSIYVKTKSYKSMLKVQRNIINGYISDMAKYAPKSDRIKAHECFQSIPVQLAKVNKKFQYKVVRAGYNARYYDASLRWLEDSGLISRVHRLKDIAIPLEAYAELPVFKVYMFDTGLLISQFDDALVAQIYSGDTMIFKGALYENIVAQMLQAKGKKIYYFEPNTSSEIDFITYSENVITPIEIKSSDNTRSKSFTDFVSRYQSKLGYRFSSKNIGRMDSNIYYLPYYLLPFIDSILTLTDSY